MLHLLEPTASGILLRSGDILVRRQGQPQDSPSTAHRLLLEWSSPKEAIHVRPHRFKGEGHLEAALRFYAAALKPLGHVVCAQEEGCAGIGLNSEPALWLYAAKGTKTTGTHVAFRAPDRAAVERFHKERLKAGGHDYGAPGVGADYNPTYYAAFLIDPDGNNVEAVCVRP